MFFVIGYFLASQNLETTMQTCILMALWCHYIPANSHALCVSLVPADLKSKNNFSRLSDNSECNCLKTFEKSSQHFQNSLQCSRLVGNCWCAHFWRHQKSLYTFARLSSEVVGKSSEVVGNLRRSLEVFRKLQQSSEAVDKHLEIQVLWRRINFVCPMLKLLLAIFRHIFGAENLE